MSEENKQADLSFLEPFKKSCGRPNCNWCEYEYPMWQSIHAQLNTEQSKFLEKFEMDAAMDSTDLASYKAVLDGDWPNSVEILEAALERAKAFQSFTDEEVEEYYNLPDNEKRAFYEKRKKAEKV